ncbi:MAG: hypothetical protein JSV17_09350 [Candidatus Aminicenantes bacterium]|nr:MAG: hypothetical protein JSV17_09350 [Candidatus Aminicenantes bacterium]
MKKTSLFILVVFVSIIFLSPFILAKEDFDLRTIKKAIKKNPKYKRGREVLWFKLLIMDGDCKKDRLEITLPLSLVDLLFECTKDKKMNIDCGDYDLNLRKLYKELKRRGPKSLIEIRGKDGVLKIWLE